MATNFNARTFTTAGSFFNYKYFHEALNRNWVRSWQRGFLMQFRVWFRCRSSSVSMLYIKQCLYEGLICFNTRTDTFYYNWGQTFLESGCRISLIDSMGNRDQQIHENLSALYFISEKNFACHSMISDFTSA